ncbi:MAG: Dps family protein [Acidobacteriota bacterium]|nr:Dps family protein [Acidobacteriota bacterium]
MKIDIGIDKAHRREIADGLSKLLADSYTLYLKTHNYHWNVEGPMFNTLHQMFEEQYTELAEAVDVIAERIRALGFPAPGSYEEFQKLTSIEQEKEEGIAAEEMVKRLVRSHEAVVKTARSVLPSADKATDEPSVDLLVERMRLHEKTAWMLRSMVA